MKKFAIAYIFSLIAGWYSTAYAQLPAFTTANLQTFYVGLSSSGWRSMATDVDTAGLRAMFSRHFTLSHDDSTDFSQIALYDPDYKSLYSLNTRRVANQLDSGRSLDVSGTLISNTGNMKTVSTLHTDLVLIPCCPPSCAISFWFTKSRSNS